MYHDCLQCIDFDCHSTGSTVSVRSRIIIRALVSNRVTRRRNRKIILIVGRVATREPIIAEWHTKHPNHKWTGGG